MRAVRSLVFLTLLARATPAIAAPPPGPLPSSAGEGEGRPSSQPFVPDGPLGVGTPGTFRQLFLDMPLADARGAGGGLGFDARWWLANDWSVPTALTKGTHLVWVQQDEQSDVLQLALTVPWRKLGKESWLERWQTTAELRFIQHWGGWTDRGIEGWHGLIGSTNFRRERYHRNRVNLRLAEDGGRTLADLRHPQAALSDLALRTQGRLAAGKPRQDGEVPWAVALRADLKLPTGRLQVLGGSGGVDAGLGLAATAAPNRWLTLHGQGAVRFVSPLPHGFPLQPERVQWGLDVSAAVRIRDRVALILEDRVSSPLFRGGWRLPPDEKDPESTAYYGLFRITNQISGGLRVGEVTIIFSEDFTPGARLATDPGPRWFYNSNAPDVVLGVAWAREL